MSSKGLYKQFVYPEALLRQSEKEAKKRHLLKCSLHEGEEHEIILVCTNLNCNLNRFLCALCVPQHELCGASLIVLSKIEKEDVSIMDPRISKEAKEVLRHYADQKKLMEDVDSFFDELKHKILREVEQARRDARLHVDRLLKDRGGSLRELIDIVCSTFNYNSYRVLLKDLEQGRVSQEDASRRLTLYIQSKDRSLKLKEVANLLANGAVPSRHLTLQAFAQDIKKIQQAISAIKFGLISFEEQTAPQVRRLPSANDRTDDSIQLVDPFLHELPQLLRGRKSATIKGKRFGLQSVALTLDIQFPRDGYFLQKVKKSTYYSFESMVQLLADGLLSSDLDSVSLEIDDKWLGYRELLLLMDLLSDRRFTSFQLKLRSDRVRQSKRKALRAKAGPMKLTFL